MRVLFEIIICVYAIVVTFLYIMKGADLTALKLETKQKQPGWDDKVFAKFLWKY
jgi:hypothetical protein